MKLETAKALLRYAKQFMDLGKLRVVHDTSWYYMPKYSAIAIMKREDEDREDINHNYWFMSYVEREFGLDLTYDEIEIFGLFHELGHHMNGWILEPEVYHMLVDEAVSMYEYRQIADERKADEFAASFIKEHYDDLARIYTEEESY